MQLIEKYNAAMSLLLAAFTFAFGDNIIEKIPFINPELNDIMVTLLALLFFIPCIVYIYKQLETIKVHIDSFLYYEESYILLLMVVAFLGTIWDSFTTLIGLVSFLKIEILGNSDNSGLPINILIPSLICVSVIYIGFLLPIAFVVKSKLNNIYKNLFYIFYSIALSFDLYTSVIGNAQVVGVSGKSIKSLIYDKPILALMLICITIFTTISPTIVSAIFKYIKDKREEE